MALISISGVALPTPSEYDVGIIDLSKAERNAKGTMIIERIATKRKLEVGWAFLTGAEYSRILNLVDPVFFSVTYFDPKANGMKTGTFYSGDRQAPMLIFKNGQAEWKDIKFSLIEK
ncbi:hypothetical protein AM500_21360 [Bacillus sp. FJAT-18017]|uniref:DUF6711 family protein n=1 Tax=Bacillus sp. FJAT-18017 TaxID=1705566 RepID=UPI0006BC4396|nr:DUF6711 family protein [Bacillus sp. FJAT-18017]ALC92058.1 hypothetical protein AM500_21360 [Bacillus sp. FJAT-18017]